MSDIKRLNYFIGQFLTADDFRDEQAYHIGQRRRANRLRYGPGILDGLLVKPGEAINTVTVEPGTAIDREGQEIVLLDPRTLDIGQASAGDHYLVVTYDDYQDPADKRKDGEFEGAVRVTERVEITLLDAPPAGDRVGLDLVVARITVTVDDDDNRQVDIHNDDPQRQPSRLQFSNEGGNKLVLYDTGPTDRYGFGLNSGNLNAFVPAGGRFSLRQNGYDGTEVVSITGGGKVGIGTNSPSAALEIQGPNAPTGAAGQRDISLSFAGAGSARIRAFRGESWDTYLQLLTNAGTRLSDNPEVRLHIGQDGNVGIGTTAPSAQLSVVAAGATEIAGSAQSNALRVSAGYLGGATGEKMSLASVGFLTKDNATDGVNNVALGIRAHRYSDGTSWNTTRVGLSLDVDNTPDAGPSLWLSSPAILDGVYMHPRVMIENGALMPTAGNTDSDGILFPSNPGGGSGDKAWIRYYARPPRAGTTDSPERSALELGVHNDGLGGDQDDILLMPSGGVGIGTTTPSAKLDVQGDIAVTGTVDGRDISADGARLDSHVGNTSNPHATTAAQIGALPAVQTFHFGLSGVSTDQDVRHHLANAEIGSFVIGVTDRGGEYPDFRIYYMDQSRTIRKLAWQGAELQ